MFALVSTLALFEAIFGNRIGANVQLIGFDISRLQGSVSFSDNDIDIDGEQLVVPPPMVEWDGADGIDNDLDTRADCDDVDCSFAPTCG